MSETIDRISFNKGYTKYGFSNKVFHIHLRNEYDINELYFRDYLNEFYDIRIEYEILKLGLEKIYKYDRDAYTKAKEDFVIDITNKALKYYGLKYE